MTRSRMARTAAVFDAWPTECVVLSLDGMIVTANGAWRRFGEDNGAGVRCGPGTNYLRVTEAAAVTGDEVAVVALNALEAVLSGNALRAQLDYPCHSPEQQRWFRLRAEPLPGRRELLVMHDDITQYALGESRLASATVGASLPSQSGGDAVHAPRSAHAGSDGGRAGRPSVRATTVVPSLIGASRW